MHPGNRFFVDLTMDTNGFDIGYLHVEDLYYAEYDHEGEQVGDTMHLIGDGCSMVGPLIEMKGFLVSSRKKTDVSIQIEHRKIRNSFF